MMFPRALMPLLFLACLLLTSRAADSGLTESGLVLSDVGRSLLEQPVDKPNVQKCPTGQTCTCHTEIWTCSATGDDISGNYQQTDPNFRCTGGYFFRKFVPDCPCYSKKQHCFQAKPATVANGINANGIQNAEVQQQHCEANSDDYLLAPCGGAEGGTDPIITGFDERKFHFNDVGNFTLLSDAEGYLLEATFVGVGPIEDVPKETSWTSQVRIYNPKGDKVVCHLPHILPNTSRIEVSAQAAGSSKVTPMTPFHHTSVQYNDMSATAVLSAGPNPVVIGCHVALPKLEVTVYQVSGWDQASRFESEKWAAPYTWLNFEVKLLKPLTLPVMGILGATYPVTPQDQAVLDAMAETGKIVRANVATDPVAMRELEDTASAPGKARRLFSADMFPLAATFKGMQLP